VTVRAIVLIAVVVVCAFACGGAPAQIVDYSPQRGTKDVPTVAPISITFDHDVDTASVASRLHLVPATPGTIQWQSPRQLSYNHPTLLTATVYEVVLEAGYRDTAGNAYSLRHHWSFTTELPPAVTATSPAQGESGLDPAAYLTVDFTRAMDATSVRDAIAFAPSVSFNVRLDPADARRAIVAPDALLSPNTTYEMYLSTTASDVDGNQLDLSRTISFATGAVRPLRHWVAFATRDAAGRSGGLWIVNDSGFPRQLLGVSSLQSYSWAPEGDRLVYESDPGSWSTFTPGSGTSALDFKASWAAALASGLGYVYIDVGGVLTRELADGTSFTIATSVTDAAVGPDGSRIAFVQDQLDGTTKIWGYDTGLRSRYVLATETGVVTGLTWSPAGNRLAYLLQDASATALRVRSLTGAASTTTVASGDLGPPAWLRDSDHIVLSATVPGSAGPIRKAFLINVVAPPATLTPAVGLPSDPAIDVLDPVPSPDGHQIAFINGQQVWLMNADGTRPTPLTRFDANAFPYSCLMPAWTRS
jgi:hypothetical protein